MSTVNKSLALNDTATTQYLSRADNAAIRVANGWTVELLVLVNRLNTNAYLAYSRNGENGWAITMANPSGENIVIRVEGGSGSFDGANGTVNINDGKFHHVRVYYNGASTKLYIDGVLDSTLNVPNITNPNSTVYFGTKAATAGTYFKGCLSLIRIWDNEHTTADGTTIYGTATSNMKAEWSLDSTLNDASGNGLTLTANGSPAPTYIPAAHHSMQVSGLPYVGHHDDRPDVQGGTTSNTREIYVAKAGSTIVVAISSATAGDNHGTPQIEGVNMTQIQGAITGTNRRGTLWYKENVGVGAQTLTISPSSISNRYSWGFTVLENVATSSPVDVSAQGGNATGTSRTASLTLNQANSVMLVWNFNLYDAGTNSTKLFGTGDDHNLFVNADAKSAGSFSMTATSSSTDNAYVAVAFKSGATDVTATPSVVAAAFSIPAPAAQTGSTVTPTAKSIVASLPAPSISAGATISPAVQSALFSLPAANILTPDALITPSPLTATFSIPAPAVNLDMVVAVANALSATFGIPAASILQGAGFTPNAMSLTFGIPQPQVNLDMLVAVAAQAMLMSIPTPSVGIFVTVTPNALTITMSIPTPAVVLAAIAQPNPVEMTLALLHPFVRGTGYQRKYTEQGNIYEIKYTP